MADPVATVEKIVKIGLKIKDAVDTVRHNEEECKEIRRRVLRFSAILSQLQQTGVMDGSTAMSGALEDLEETLQQALELITACQERSAIRRLIAAGDLSKQLRRVKDDILNKVMLASFAVNAHTTIVLLTIQAGGGHPPPPRLPEDEGMVETSHKNHSTPDPRSELNVAENNIVARSEAPFVPLLAVVIREFKWSELKAATNNFSDSNIIGQGGTFVIYKGVLKGGNVVAIKRSYCFSSWPSSCDQILLAVSKLQHKNIVKFVGYHRHREASSTYVVQFFKRKMGLAKENEFIWVEEYVPNGSLDKIMRGSQHSQLDWSSLFRIIKGIAQGLHYLHQKRVVHRDVKPGNILLDSDMNPVITDFNLSMVLDDNDEMIATIDTLSLMELPYEHEMIQTNVAGTWGYIAPEYMTESIVSTKNDVYAFGITLLEVVSSIRRSIPTRAVSYYPWAWEAWEAGRIEEEFDPTLSDGSQLTKIRRCLQIGLLCAQHHREDRPTMADVIEMLHGVQKLPIPKKPGYVIKKVEAKSPGRLPAHQRGLADVLEDEWYHQESPSAWSSGSLSPR